MHVVFEVRTNRFIGVAPRGGVNDLVGGDELANWLSTALREREYGAVDPWAEDHGWDFAVRHNDIVYLVTCSYDFEDDGRPATEFFVQITVTQPDGSASGATETGCGCRPGRGRDSRVAVRRA